MADVTYEIAHVGINVENEESALLLAKLLAATFDLQTKDMSKSVFAGGLFECMKLPNRGTKGHIGLFASDLSAALRRLEAKGVHFSYDDTLMHNLDGSIKNIYLRDEIGGFAIHIMQKP